MNLFEHPWPSDLPPHCPHCKRPFTTSRNLSIGPGRVSRFFRACAYWSMVPWSFLGWVLLATWLNPLSLALFCFVPLILFMPFAILAPDSRRVRCFRCDYKHDFPARAGH
jgi:hypothetical protein